MSRSLATVFLLIAASLGAQDLLVPTPRWSVSIPGPVAVDRPFHATVTMRIPPGYYQDADSAFFRIEASSPYRVLSRNRPPTILRESKASWTGTVFFDVVVVTHDVSSPLRWNWGWQICQLDGVCLLPSAASFTQTISASPSSALPVSDLWAALLAAFLGGLLLNVMPCVFPVIALKAVGLASLAGVERRSRRREAWLFAAGGWALLTGLGVATALVAETGQRWDWGFSFQQPVFVWILSAVFWIFALQLAGVWTWTSSPFSLTVTSQSRVLRPFIGGAFLVVSAAPCTAPLLGPALGVAFGLPPLYLPVFFSVAGLGLILPLLLISLAPGLTRVLPKPGRWMIVVERVAAVPLALTSVYLAWVVSQQSGPPIWWWWAGAAAVAAAGLALGTRRPVRLRRVILSATMVVASLLSVGALLPPAKTHAASVKLPSGWEPFSWERLSESEKRPVLVDATAAWCATCQINEAAVLLRPDVDAILRRYDVVRLRADYTLPSDAIARWLGSVHRAGLPVYALYRPGTPPYLFPELLTDDNFTKILPRLLSDNAADLPSLDAPRPIQ